MSIMSKLKETFKVEEKQNFLVSCLLLIFKFHLAPSSCCFLLELYSFAAKKVTMFSGVSVSGYKFSVRYPIFNTPFCPLSFV